MNRAVVYLHGKGGNADDALNFAKLFPTADVFGFDYRAQTPWEAEEEFPPYFERLSLRYERVDIIAESLGAYFAVQALGDSKIGKAYFISPLVDMERMILNLLFFSGAAENDLREQKEIPTDFGETLSWEYLCYVRTHPVNWNIPTDILCAENDELIPFDTVRLFAEKSPCTVTVMPGGEHWFHTPEQLDYLGAWIAARESP